MGTNALNALSLRGRKEIVRKASGKVPGHQEYKSYFRETAQIPQTTLPWKKKHDRLEKKMLQADKRQGDRRKRSDEE